VLLVDGLPGDAEGLGDLLPRPAASPGVADLEDLQAVGELAEGTDGAQADRGVVGGGRGGHVGGGSGHDVNIG
jgi:hypothetical protein